MTQIQLKPVKSSSLKAIGYNAAEKRLRVQFHTGDIYDYANVPKAKHDAIFKAVSIGRYFMTSIMPNHKHTKVS